MKHNKIKNTSVLFEVLTRAMVHEAMHETSKPVSMMIIKKHFKRGSNLLKELNLYQTLMTKSEHAANDVFNLTLQERAKIDVKELNREKYELIKSIKKHYDVKQLTETRISNYKLGAAIFKLFEGSAKDPNDYLNCKKLIFEQLEGIKSAIDPIDEHIESELKALDSDERKLTLKFVVEKFNEKYREFNAKQKQLLSMYINEESNSPAFKDYVMEEVGYINSRLNSMADTLVDGVMKIKLVETLNLTESIISSKNITDEQLSSMLKYYELIEEIENIRKD